MNRIIKSLVFSLVMFFSFQTKISAQEIVLPITEDTYSESIFFDEPHGDLKYLLLGYGNSAREGITKIYLKYDTAQLTQIRAEDIEMAYLHLYQSSVNSAIAYPTLTCSLSSDWSESTLSEFFFHPEIDTNTCIQSLVPNQVGWVDIDITSILKGQLIDSNRFGIHIRMEDDMQKGGRFWSKDCLNFPGYNMCTSDLKPYVSVKIKEVERKLDIISHSIENNSINFAWKSNFESKDGFRIEISKNGNITQKIENIKGNNIKLSLDQDGTYELLIVSNDYNEVKDILKIEFTYTETKPADQEIHNEIEPSDTTILQQLEDNLSSEIIQTSEVSTSIAKLPNKQEIESTRSVLGASVSNNIENTCYVTYNESTRKVRIDKCRIATPQVISLKQKSNEVWAYYIKASLNVPTKLTIIQRTVICKKKSVLNPKTLIFCVEKRIRENKKTVSDININIFTKVEQEIYQGYSSWKNNEVTLTIPLVSNANKKKVSFFYTLSYSQKMSESSWLDIYMKSLLTNPLVLNSIKATTPPYQFPLNKFFDVTQWYGKTVYQNPHTGIDFSVTKQPVISTTDGVVIFAGWDDSSGKCLSGGNYILLKHRDGKYSTYLHLMNFDKKMKAGTSVKKGQVLGISGNSGAFNCEPLSYHFHFEIRSGKSYKTHINPVPLINVDWLKILTSSYQKYPGRLSGDNPHPLF